MERVKGKNEAQMMKYVITDCKKVKPKMKRSEKWEKRAQLDHEDYIKKSRSKEYGQMNEEVELRMMRRDHIMLNLRYPQ